MQTCMECNIFLYQIQKFMKKVQTQQQLNSEENLNAKILTVTCSNEVLDDECTTLNLIDEEEESVYGVLSDPETAQLIEESENKPTKQSNNEEKNDDEKLFIFKCHICDVTEFNKMFQLSAHTRSKHSCLPLVKCFCDKQLSTMRGLQRHRAKHFPNPNDISCHECCKNFKTQKGLQNHFEKWHGPNKDLFICSRKFFFLHL